MSEPGMEDRFDVQPTVSDHFSWIRTRFAVERTFMAWLRTSVSLIGFGFTIVQFFQHLQSLGGPNGQRMAEEMPRNLGLALIGSGIGALAVSALQYRQMHKYLWGDRFKAIRGIHESPHWTPVMAAAFVLLGIGVAAFVSVFFHFM